MNVAIAARTAADPTMLNRLLDRGRTMLRQKKPLEAIAMLGRAVAIPDAPAEAFGLYAEALLDAGRAQEALLAAEQAVGCKGEDGALRLLRARIRRDCSDRRGAMDDAAAAVMADPSNAEAKTLLATCLSEAGQHDEALVLLHQVFVADPRNAHRTAMLAMAFMRAGKHEAAEELYALAGELSGGSRAILVLRAQNAILQGAPGLAVGMLLGSLEQSAEESPVWSMLGQAYQKLGQIESAAGAYREALRIDPDNAYLRHLARAIGAVASAADRADDQYVVEVFDGCATRFEQSLFALGYRVPGVMLRMLETHDPLLSETGRKLGDVLDLGCGTGLMGAALHDLLGGRLVGVDLSPRMLDASRDKGVYTELRQSEIVAAMEADPSQYALILLADVLCYFGAVERCFAAARARLSPGGLLLLSVEGGVVEGDWTLSSNARYRHAEAYIRAGLAGAGLVPIQFAAEVLRYEKGNPVDGYIVLAGVAH